MPLHNTAESVVYGSTATHLGRVKPGVGHTTSHCWDTEYKEHFPLYFTERDLCLSCIRTLAPHYYYYNTVLPCTFSITSHYNIYHCTFSIM